MKKHKANPREAKFNISSSSLPMASSVSERIRELGRRLVQELQLQDGVDTLGRWMAHYVAESMHVATTATGPQAAKAKRDCFKTIIALWEHLHQSRGSAAAFCNYEQAVETLNLLHPASSEHDWHGYRMRRERAENTARKSHRHARRIQDFIIDIDWGTRLILEYLIGELSALTTSPTKDDSILDLLPDCPKSDVFRTLYLVGKRKAFNEPGVTKSTLLNQRIRVLERFEKLARTLGANMKDELSRITEKPSKTDTSPVQDRARTRTGRRVRQSR